MKRLTFSSALLACLFLTACSQDQSGEENGKSSEKEDSSSDVVGFYTYSDPTRGTYSLALMEKNRFMLVTESAPGIPEGAVGWYALRDREIHLSSDELDAEGLVEGEIVRLSFGETDPEDEQSDDGLPFQRQNQSQGKPAEGDNNKSSDKSSEQSSDSSSGQSSEESSNQSSEK